MISLDTYRTQWFGNIRGDLLAGLVVALALIPEAIAFSIIAGVDPKVGLYASFSIAVLIAFTGGRPGMISAATAATLAIGDLVPHPANVRSNSPETYDPENIAHLKASIAILGLLQPLLVQKLDGKYAGRLRG